jgi:hypothetical protein
MACGAERTGEPCGSPGAPWIVALVAACAALPGLGLPFLSDDWAQVAAVGSGIPRGTPFGDFRPLYMATLWLDRALWSLRPAAFHATNLLWIVAAAGLLVTVVRRLTGDPRLATVTGLLFAVHPCHVENAAWIAARGDPLFSVPYLLGFLAYDAWRERARGLPARALSLYWIALLAKETAISLPFLLLLLAGLDRRRRPTGREWRRGYLPLAAVTLGHFLGLRLLSLGGAGRTLAENLGRGTPKTFLGLAAAAILPVDLEHLARHPLVWGAIAGAIPVLMLSLTGPGAAPPSSPRAPRYALAAAAIFAVVVAPYLVGFQDRYLFLPSAAAALFYASVLRSARGRVASALMVVLAALALAGSGARWLGWREAATASRMLIADLERAADDPRVAEIVVANLPFRVRGASVAGDFRAALALGGRRPIPVRTVTSVSYPAATADPLVIDVPDADATIHPPGGAEVLLRIPVAPYWHLVFPRPGEGVGTTSEIGSVRFEDQGRVRVRLFAAPGGGRAGYVWSRGRLERLF